VNSRNDNEPRLPMMVMMSVVRNVIYGNVVSKSGSEGATTCEPKPFHYLLKNGLREKRDTPDGDTEEKVEARFLVTETAQRSFRHKLGCSIRHKSTRTVSMWELIH